MFLHFSCSKKVYYSNEVKNWKTDSMPDSSLLKYTIFLIGDAGDPNLTSAEPTLKILQDQIEKDSIAQSDLPGDE